MDIKQVKAIIKKYIKTLLQDGIKIEKVILFGSYAENKAKDNSDIDLCIISKNFGKNKIEEMSYLLLKAYDICTLIEAIPYHTDYFRENDYLPLIDEIVTKGIEIPIS